MSAAGTDVLGSGDSPRNTQRRCQQIAVIASHEAAGADPMMTPDRLTNMSESEPRRD